MEVTYVSMTEMATKSQTVIQMETDNLDDSESIGCLKANVSPLNPQLLRDDPDSFLPDGFGPVSVYPRFRDTTERRM